MNLEAYIGQGILAIATAFAAWFFSRKRQKVDTRKVEVEVLENSLRVVEANVVKPLRDQIEYLQERDKSINLKLAKLQNALNKIYRCHFLHSCPVRNELQSPEKPHGKKGSGKVPTNRQREHPGGEDDPGSDDTTEESEPHPYS